jgi:predicted SAM-dependent methyltransferase
MKEIGFINVIGIDPFIRGTISYPNGVIIEKKDLSEINSNWDMILYNHVFEHIADPIKELVKVNSLLKKGGSCIIRIPNIDSFAWENYKTDWVQLDAPRHFYLYSVKSINILAEKAGLKIEKIDYDSTSFQFWGSEQLKNDIPLRDSRSYSINRKKSIFSKKTIRRFEAQAIELNEQKLGDQAIYHLRKL